MQKNDFIELVIEDLGTDGAGIGRYQGMTFFVKDAVIGDTVLAKIMKLKKTYGYARLMEIKEASPNRVKPRCLYAKSCGGCQIQQMDYKSQLVYKQRKIRANLVRIGGFDEALIDRVMEPIVGMEEPFGYRNKAQFPIGKNGDGETVAGFYAGRTHSIIANTDCALGVPVNKEILETILAFMREYRVPAYDESERTGLIRHVLIRYGFDSKEIMVCLVANGETIPHEEILAERLGRIPGMTSICLNVNTENTNVILGERTRTIWGSPEITDALYLRNTSDFQRSGEKTVYRISAQSFYQVNPVQTEKLYSLALEYAGLTGKETVWDLYCGIGTISLFLAGSAKQVYGVEAVHQAVQDARMNAKRNGIENAVFLEGKAEEVLPEFYGKTVVRGNDKAGDDCPAAVDMCLDGTVRHGECGAVDACPDETEGMRHPDVIVVDPPRKGCDEKCLETMLCMRPERIVYVSCDSATLARDLRKLCDGGYEVKRVRGVDQFGQTIHVEVACCLQRKDS